MRILHLVHQYLPEHIGGTERYTQSVARALADAGHAAGIFYRRDAAGVGLAQRDESGVPVWAAWAGAQNPTERFLTTFRASHLQQMFEHVLDDFKPDLLHLQHLMGLPVQIVHSLRRRHIPFVITLHDFWWVCANAQLLTNYNRQVCSGPRGWLNCAHCAFARAGVSGLWPLAPALAPLLAARARQQKTVLLAADALIAPTEFVRSWYARHGAPGAKIRVLAHGIEPYAPLPVRDHAARPVRFAYIGGLTWQKGVHVLVDGFNALTGEAELWVAGSPAADPAYARQIEARLGGNARFLGALTQQQVRETLAQVDLLVVPSLWYEAFSLIAHEAFAAGVPVAASRLGALAEVVREGVDGVLAPPGDEAAWRATLQRLVDEPAYLARLRTGVRPPLSLAEHARRLSGIYTEIIGRPE